MATVNLEDILKLPVSERLRLVEEIWDSIAAESEQLPLTEAQREELDRRLEELEANPSDGVPWEEARKRYFGS